MESSEEPQSLHNEVKQLTQKMLSAAAINEETENIEHEVVSDEELEQARRTLPYSQGTGGEDQLNSGSVDSYKEHLWYPNWNSNMSSHST